MEDAQNLNNNSGNFIDAQEIVKLLVRNWHLFAFFLGIAMVLAILFYNYAPAKYSVGATVKINIQETADQDQFGVHKL